MDKIDYSKLGVKPEEVGPLLLALRPLTCVCGVPFGEHIREDHLFIDELSLIERAHAIFIAREAGVVGEVLRVEKMARDAKRHAMRVVEATGRPISSQSNGLSLRLSTEGEGESHE